MAYVCKNIKDLKPGDRFLFDVDRTSTAKDVVIFDSFLSPFAHGHYLIDGIEIICENADDLYVYKII